MSNIITTMVSPNILNIDLSMIKNFLPPKLKYDSSLCFSPGSSCGEQSRTIAVLSGAAPPPFRIFAGGLPRRRRRGRALLYLHPVRHAPWEESNPHNWLRSPVFCLHPVRYPPERNRTPINALEERCFIH